MDMEIGTAAGDIYRCLAANGPTSLSALRKATGHKDATVAMAIGWLAREDKIARDDRGRGTRWLLAEPEAQA